MLARVASLFARRGYNIYSLAVCAHRRRPLQPHHHRRRRRVAPLEQIAKQLFKLINVVKISELAPGDGGRARAAAGHGAGRARPAGPGGGAGRRSSRAGSSPSATTRSRSRLEGIADKLDDFEELLRAYGIVELQRTGRVALPKLVRRRAASHSSERPADGPPPSCYEADADRSTHRRAQGGRHRLRLPGPRPRPQPEGLGVDVRVGLREGSSSMAKAEAAGLRVVSIADAAAEADVVMILLPDTEQKRIYEADIAPNLQPGDAVAFAHGFNIRFEPDRAGRGPRRLHGGAQGTRPPRAPHLRRGRWRAVPHRRRTRTPRARPATWPSRTPTPSVAPGPASSRRASPRRPRPTCSVSRWCCAAGSRPWCRPASRRWWKPATSRRWPTSSASTR